MAWESAIGTVGVSEAAATPGRHGGESTAGWGHGGVGIGDYRPVSWREREPVHVHAGDPCLGQVCQAQAHHTAENLQRGHGGGGAGEPSASLAAPQPSALIAPRAGLGVRGAATAEEGGPDAGGGVRRRAHGPAGSPCGCLGRSSAGDRTLCAAGGSGVTVPTSCSSRGEGLLLEGSALLRV